MFSNCLIVCGQLAVLLLTAAGWGHWIRRAAFRGGRLSGCDVLLTGIAGLCLCWLLLQDLAYIDIRLSYSSWIAAAIGAAGLVGALRAAALAGDRPAFHGRRRIAWSWAAVGLAVFAFQGSGLISQGPRDYYGSAHVDQVNYVEVAQFLIEKPYSTRLKDVGLHPWLVKGIDSKSGRLGECMADAYVAVLSGTDAESSYGTTSIFPVALLSIVMLELLSALGVPRLQAGLAAVWCGVLPAITKTHLDGFLSQTAVLFVAPALMLALLVAGRSFRLSWIAAACLLGFLLSAYTEVYVVGLALAGAAALSQTRLSGARRLALLALAGAGSLILNAPYIGRGALAFLFRQYRAAAVPNTLADLVPNAGTWKGWSELFFQAPAAGSFVGQIARPVGFCLVGLLILGLFSQNRRKALMLCGMIGAPFAVLALLLARPVVPKYAFEKLLVTFLPCAVILIALGCVRLQSALGLMIRTWRDSRRSIAAPANSNRLLAAGTAAVFAVMLGFSANGSWAQLRSVMSNFGILAAVDSPLARRTYRELERHPERVYVIKEQHNIVNAWLAYHGRHAEMYLDSNTLSDRPVPSDQFQFRRIPANLGSAWFVTGDGARFNADTDGSPEIIVRNPQGMDQEGLLIWYWVGDSLQFELMHFGRQPGAYKLSMHAMAGFANPSPERVVSLVDLQGGKRQTRWFTDSAYLVFPVTLKPGSNFFTLRVDKPTEWLVRIPTDPRKHMLRVQEVSLSLQ